MKYNKPAQSAIVFDRLRNCWRRAGYKYRRSVDGDAAAGHSFGGCRTNTLNQPRTKAVPRAWMYCKGAEFTYTGILNSEEDTKMKHIFIDTFCSSVHPTIRPIWIVQIKPDYQ
ncbi:hypothetical protein V1477_005765 [Vespula maculifrons]|uniref:Uncharacterized protein n=1 Tax=Vespula maculifrons TaxID=7453 RepID=A0ABD2CLX7_VESMC